MKIAFRCIIGPNSINDLDDDGIVVVVTNML